MARVPINRGGPPWILHPNLYLRSDLRSMKPLLPQATSANRRHSGSVRLIANRSSMMIAGGDRKPLA